MKKCLEVCLPDYAPLLNELAVLIGATYESGAYEKAEERFIESDLESAKWTLAGDKGDLEVLFEKYEGYYFAKFRADKSTFVAGYELLKREYLMQGGEPNKF